MKVGFTAGLLYYTVFQAKIQNKKKILASAPQMRAVSIFLSYIMAQYQDCNLQ